MSARRIDTEPAQQAKERRDAALNELVQRVPYARFMGFTFQRHGDELTALLPFKPLLIGNPLLPAIHGGVTAAFLETTAIIGLAWVLYQERTGGGDEALATEQALPRYPKTIDLTVDYLRTGLPRDAYARAKVNRSGRRYASVFVEAWQDSRERPFAQATGHFLMPAGRDT